MSYEPSNDMPTDNDYVSRTGQSAIPVTKDENEVEDPIDAETADSDEVLGKSVIIPSHLIFCVFLKIHDCAYA